MGFEKNNMTTPKNESQTPRTDAEMLRGGVTYRLSEVPADFARQLERELNEAKAKLEANNLPIIPKSVSVSSKLREQYRAGLCHAETILDALEDAERRLAASPDANVESIRAKLLERSKVGLAKYGVTTERNDLSALDWLNHLQEELMDAAVYCEAAITQPEKTT